nr:MarC family protein [Pseudonocardia acidicola]
MKFFISVFVTLFVIMDPVGTIPIFLALTGGRSRQERKRLAGQAVLVSFFVIAVFALFGQSILNYLGITVAAMQGAGGLLLLLVSLELLTGHEQMPAQAGDVNVALVPLGTPLLAGPGAIVATIVFVRQVHTVADAIALAGGVTAVHLSLWLIMRYSVGLLHLLRDGGITLITRISGLLLSAIAVQLVANSVTAFVKGA